MQAITTKYHGPTDHSGSRITARCQAGRITTGYGYDSKSRDHDIACAKLLVKLGWTGHWIGGGLPDGTGDCYVCLPRQLAPDGVRTTVNGVSVSELLSQ